MKCCTHSDNPQESCQIRWRWWQEEGWERLKKEEDDWRQGAKIVGCERKEPRRRHPGSGEGEESPSSDLSGLRSSSDLGLAGLLLDPSKLEINMGLHWTAALWVPGRRKLQQPAPPSHLKSSPARRARASPTALRQKDWIHTGWFCVLESQKDAKGCSIHYITPS